MAYSRSGFTGVKEKRPEVEVREVEQNGMNRERVESGARVCRPDVACPRLDSAVLVAEEGLAPHCPPSDVRQAGIDETQRGRRGRAMGTMLP